MGQNSRFLTLLLVLAYSISPFSTAAETTTSAGLQTNFGDVSFAGGMSYDSDHEIIYVTGQVGSHSCFVGVLKRVVATTSSDPSSNSVKHPTHLEFLSRQVFDERAICQTIAYRKDVTRPGNALLLSISEEGGLLTEQREEGSRRAKQYGGLLALQYSADGSSSEYRPDHSVLIYPAAVTIPRSITNDPKKTNRVFVATMTSDSTEIQYRDALGSPHVSEGGGGGVTTKPNLTPGGGMLKYGNNFAMTVESIRLSTEFSSAEPQWRKPFGVKRNSDNVTRNGVTVSQILCRQGGEQEDAADDKTDYGVYVVGSTLGSGPAFGKPELDNDKGYGVVAGFITKLNPDTGNLISSRRFLYNPNEDGNTNEKPLTDTYIEAVCEATDEEGAIYIVGSYDRIENNGRFRSLQDELSTEVPTETSTIDSSILADDDEFDDDHEEMEDYEIFENEPKDSDRNTISTPFIAKLSTSTLETIWQKEIESTANARALGCGVDPVAKALYIAGQIEDGGELVGRTSSLLGDDVFLLRLDTTDGAILWSKQLGTSKDDRLAYGGGGLVVLGGQQGVLLMGDTTSDLYSVSKQDSEIFIVEIDADGNLPGTTEKTGVDNSPGASLVKLSNPSKTFDGEQLNNDTLEKPKPDMKTDENVNSSDTSKPTNPRKPTDSKSRMKSGHRLYVVVGVSLVAFACLAFFFIVSEKKKREASERALVFSYLQNFDLEDIDVKKAATGGWHGTYVGSLSEGLNIRENETRSSSGGSWDGGGYGSGNENECDNEFVEQKLSKLSHSSVVRDILFMDYDDTVFSSVNPEKNTDSEDLTSDKDGIIRDPITIIEDDQDEKDVDPWGTEII